MERMSRIAGICIELMDNLEKSWQVPPMSAYDC